MRKGQKMESGPNDLNVTGDPKSVPTATRLLLLKGALCRMAAGLSRYTAMGGAEVYGSSFMFNVSDVGFILTNVGMLLEADENLSNDDVQVALISAEPEDYYAVMQPWEMARTDEDEDEIEVAGTGATIMEAVLSAYLGEGRKAR